MLSGNASNKKRRCKVDFHILQHRLFLLYEGLPYPNDRNVEPVSPAREAGSQSARKQMLFHAAREGQGRWANMGLPPHTPFYTRFLGLRKLRLPPAKPQISLPGITCSHGLCVPHGLSPYAVRSTSCGGHTRLIGMQSLSFSHAPLSASLPGGTCSLLQRAYPNDRNAEPVSPAREAAPE